MRNKLTILSLMAAALIGTGCNDFLTKEPVLTQSTELTLATFDGLDNAIAGAYAPLASYAWYGPAFVFDAELRSGNGKKPIEGDYNSGRFDVPYNLNYNESSTSGLWSYGYFVISAANNVLDAIETVDLTGIEQKDVDNLKAEALFLRAFSHFDLVRLYAQPYGYQPQGPGVPVVLKTDPAGKPARNTVAEVYAQIEADLLEAENLISDDYTRAGVTDPKAAVTKPAIQALLSRAYLYMEQWQKAADYATKVINNSKFRMWTADEYPTVWGMDAAGEGEVIFEVYGDINNAYDAYWEGPAWMTNPLGYADCAASNDLVELYADDDVRNMWQQDPDGPDYLYWTAKYPGKGAADPDANNTIVLRLSEMYLNRAEAVANGATGYNHVEDLNVITSARNAAPYLGATKDDIFNERRKELAWEGHFWFDLSRCGKGVTRIDYVGDVNKQNIPAHSYMFALPISKRELDVNENLVQNEGY